MASGSYRAKFIILPIFIFILTTECSSNDILGCGGFVKSHVSLDYSKIEIGLYTKEGSLKEKTECAPTNGYYFLPLYEKGDYVLKVHPPAGWSFEPSQVELSVDGVSDKCSSGQDVNFAFNGFGITGRVITAGQAQGPSGIAVQLVSEKGETRNTVTAAGGDFHFTPVIPGKYTVKASHPRWKLEPAQAVVQVKEGNTVLPTGVLAVKGYDVSGSVTSFGSPIEGLYVLLYSKVDNPKFRIEGCNTALLQGVPDSPICHVTTDSTGQFTFGLVPSGEYKLLALSTAPGQVAVSYNVKPEAVPFTVRHDSLYIKNAFEVTGFTVVGSVLAAPSKSLSGAQVILDDTPVGKSDASGKFTLANMQPGAYTVRFIHEKCEIDDIQVQIGTSGPRSPVVARVARWRVCGAVSPAGSRRVSIAGDNKQVIRSVNVENGGKWCTYLPSGVYTAKVEVSEQEQREGLQFYPLSHKVSVGHGPVDGITFSQLKGKLTGRVECKDTAACESITVTLKPLSPDGGYVGQPMHTVAVKGKYMFEEVLPGSVEISVPADRLCWAEARHNAAVTQADAAVPPFVHTGYIIKVHSTHAVEVEYSSKSSKGVLNIPQGASQQCVETAETYTLTPRGCHKFQPPTSKVDTSAKLPSTVHFVAVAHAVVVRVTSPEPVNDLVLTIDKDGRGEKVGPLKHTQDGGMYVFEHTLYMADGEVAVVSATSSALLFAPAAPQQVLGGAQCQHNALTLRARKGLTLKGRIVPAVADVTVTLTSDELKLTQVTTPEGTYRFGPLDASKDYVITAEKESYVFGAPDDKGQITAHKLAEIIVELVDDADGTPLQGALVSVSGGQYRRNAASGAGTALRFPSLSPAEYYVKPNMKEYKFTPPHSIIKVEEGKTHSMTLRGTRVAWSCHGRLVSLGGIGWSGATVVAVPNPDSNPRCAAEEATTEPSGAFRIRGLLPNCLYGIYLKESSNPGLAGLRLAKAPTSLQVKNNKDITDVLLIAIQPTQLTDANVLIYTPNIDHYKTLRLTLALESSPDSPIYSTKLDSGGFTQQMNPGLMYILPRLPADNKTYVVQLESTLSKATHSYKEQAQYFNSDGKFKHFTFEFLPKVKSSEQELRQSSFLIIPLLGILGVLYTQRSRLAVQWPRARAARAAPGKAARPDVLDKASIDQILSTVNAAGKKPPKKKAQ